MAEKGLPELEVSNKMLLVHMSDLDYFTIARARMEGWDSRADSTICKYWDITVTIDFQAKFNIFR